MTAQSDIGPGDGGGLVAVREQVDYAQRKRSLEWRRKWFYGHRSEDDTAFSKVMQQGLRDKHRLIEKQRHLADHLAAYAPAGAGSPWTTIGPRNVNGRVKCLAVDPTNANVLYAGAASGGVWKSSDGGQSWRALWNAQDTMAIGALGVAPSDPSIVYAATGEWTPGWSPSFPGTGLFASSDAGATWAQRSALVSRRVAQVLVSANDPSTLYVAGASGFERSTDGGISWTTLRSGTIQRAARHERRPG